MKKLVERFSSSLLVNNNRFSIIVLIMTIAISFMIGMIFERTQYEPILQTNGNYKVNDGNQVMIFK
jgi:hypothetical protein